MFKLYSKPNCPYCEKAKAFLNQRGIAFEYHELDVGQVKDPSVSYFTVPQLQKMIPGVRTVPQIYDGDTLIGGFDALQRHFAAK